MQVVYHIGAHVTDEDRLLKSLLKNAETLRERGTIVPGPGRYRRLIVETVNTLGGLEPSLDAKEALLDSIIDEDEVSRLVLSAPNCICIPDRVFMHGQFYGKIRNRSVAMAGLLNASEVEFHLSIRNPATYVPALLAQMKRDKRAEALNGIDPAHLAWSDVVRRLRAACPDARIVVWCNEDTPLIWADLLHSLAGTSPEGEPLDGSYDLLAQIMTEDGFARFETYLESHPITSSHHRHHVIETFLEKFARSEAVEEDVDYPGWTQDDIARITARYEDDFDAISAMEGVETFRP